MMEVIICIVLGSGAPCFTQSNVDWSSDIDILINKVDKYHPRPWAHISRIDFIKQADIIKSNQKKWDNDRITLEMMKLVALLKDSHSQVWLNNQDDFNHWYPIRIENFDDGMYVTGVSEEHKDMLYGKVVDFDGKNSEEVYRQVGSILAVDHEIGISRHITNYLSNSTILKLLGITRNRNKMELGLIQSDGKIITREIESSECPEFYKWAWTPNQVPTEDKVVTIFSNHQDPLPLYLTNIVDRSKDYWYKLSDDKKYLYFQFGNCSSQSGEENFSDFTQKMFDDFDKNCESIEKFIINVRYNEGGDGSIVNALVKEFVKRDSKLTRGKLYIITGKYTFSAATNFIGQMLEYTQTITVGDIASGGLNWCSDNYKFILPSSSLIVDISTMYWQKGHPSDNRGYYTPDYYTPVKSIDYFAYKDLAMDYILENKATSIKDLLFNEGFDRFLKEYESRINTNTISIKYWFPYTSFDLILFAFQKLLPVEKLDEALTVSKLNMELYPDELAPYYIAAMVYDAMGKSDKALDSFNKLSKIEANHAEANWDMERIRTLVYPINLKKEVLEKYQGTFEGNRTITYEEGILFYQSGSGRKRKLTPTTTNRFLIEGVNQRLEISIIDGKPEAIILSKYNGQKSTYRLVK